MAENNAVIVGGTSGIGLATAIRLAASGFAVHVVGRDAARVAAVTGNHPELTGHRADGGSAAEIGAVLEAIGRVDALVVTLSGAEGVGRLADLDLVLLRRAFESKFWAHLTTIQAALPHLSERASITLVGAISATAGMSGSAGIAAINAAVEGLVKPLAAELAPVRVNGISPGLVDTPWWDGIPAEARAEYFEQAAAVLPTGRVADADQVAEVVALAATNGNLTGTIIETDGGIRLVEMPL